MPPEGALGSAATHTAPSAKLLLPSARIELQDSLLLQRHKNVKKPAKQGIIPGPQRLSAVGDAPLMLRWC